MSIKINELNMNEFGPAYGRYFEWFREFFGNDECLVLVLGAMLFVKMDSCRPRAVPLFVTSAY